ncbi:MAG: DUF4097 family beta strand repeat protein [Chloroflexi bacterium]|nr:DUF4097 family beta strand repeat protein [Chloroflexota bacterium]
MSRKFIVFSTLVIATLILSACGANFNINLFTAEEVVSKSFSTDGAPRIVVEMFNGGVDVITGSNPNVDVKVTKRGGGNSQPEAQDDLKNVEVTMTQDGGAIRITARRIDRRVDIGNSGASAQLTVPNGAVLDLRTSNGGIISSGPVGDVIAQTSNGKIDVKGTVGQLDLQTSNGQITVNGGRGLLKLETSNGGIDVTADNVAVDARTSNGQVRFTGSLAGGTHELRTSNAGIVITLPAEAAFNVDADTSNGKINSDFTVSSSDFSDTRLRGTVGGGGQTTIGLYASNGNIELRRSR